MREDMHKVFAERARWGSRNSRRRGRLAGADDLPVKIGSRRFVQLTDAHQKGQIENQRPLERYIASQVGRPWRKVYAEICAKLDSRHAVKQALRDHLEAVISYRLGVGRDGEWFDAGGEVHPEGPRWTSDYYVDPNDGIIKDSAKYWRKHRIDPKAGWSHFRKVYEVDPNVVRLSEDLELIRLGGLWFAVTYCQCAAETTETHVYDVVTKRMLPAGQRHARSKRQLSARELAEYGLQNDNQVAGGAVPQRHKRKRKRS